MGCGHWTLLTVMAVSAAVFMIMGGIFVAPYWLFDGVSFLCSGILGRFAIRNWQRSEQGDSSAAPVALTYSRAVVCVAACSIVIEISFLVAALLLWKKEMNPLHRTSYGENGSSFFFCSMYSSILNCFVVAHFLKLGRAEAEGKSSPSPA